MCQKHKGKITSVQAIKVWGEWWYGFTYSSPRHETELGGQLHTLAALRQEEPHPIPLGGHLVGARTHPNALRKENSLIPDGIRTDSSSS